MLAALLTVVALLDIWLGSDVAQHRLPAALIASAITAPIAVRRRWPAFVGTAVPVISAVEHAFWDPRSIAYPIATFCALYALAVWTPPRRFVLGLALVVIADLAPNVGSNGGMRYAAGFAVLEVVVILLVRHVVGDRERRAQLAERERDMVVREAVVDERERIARELHDVIAHHVSMIVLQAGAERRVLGDASGSTREVLETIERSGRGALTEMRRLLGMLRGEENEPLAPQPGLDDVPTLVGQLREAGVPVELRMDGDRRELPVGIELSAYRIVQEALTNALKHGGDARVTVHVYRGAHVLELEIENDGTGTGSRVSNSGHGLVGIRERVALYGGRLDVGHRQSGGFLVRVRLPIR